MCAGPGSQSLRRRRIFWAITILCVVGVVAFGWLQLRRIDTGVTARRAQRDAADLRLCEVAINGSRADFRGLVEELAAVATPAADEAEAERRAQTQRIVAERYSPVDCETFVMLGEP